MGTCAAGQYQLLDHRHSGGSGGRRVEAAAVRAVGRVWTARAPVGHLGAVGAAVQTPPLIRCGERKIEVILQAGKDLWGTGRVGGLPPACFVCKIATSCICCGMWEHDDEVYLSI